MSTVTLVHPESSLAVPILQAVTKCSLFQRKPTLLATPYQIQSSVSLSVFQEFVSELENASVTITDANFTELQRLCYEFGFDDLSAKLSKLRPSFIFQESEDADARGRIAALEEKTKQHDRAIQALQDALAQHFPNFGRREVSALPPQCATGDPVVEQLSTGLSELQKEVFTLKRQVAGLPLDSRIIADFPVIFAELREKKFGLLWRGSRDGFEGAEFHRRCDGHANTVTVILDTNGNVFGGFTPVEWESRTSNFDKADESLKSFLFTLRNPHNIPERRFALKTEKKDWAICCDSKDGPWFCSGLGVYGNCNANTKSYSCLGVHYVNDTGLDGEVVFTGSKKFQVKEIEVFEITD